MAEEEGAWVPKTEIGKKVMSKEITSIDRIFEMGKPIIEHQLVDVLLPNLKSETLEISNTQRMTDCGRKAQFRAVVIVGDENGHVGIGFGKSEEVRPAIETAERDAKRKLIKVPLGCGSWECGCGTKHTIPITVKGKNGSVEVVLKPAPRGVGVAANEVARKMLLLAGVKDAWSFSRGHTSTVYNNAMAVYRALDSLNGMKIRGSWEKEEEQVVAEQAAAKEMAQEKDEKKEEEAAPEEKPEKTAEKEEIAEKEGKAETPEKKGKKEGKEEGDKGAGEESEEK